MRTLTFPYTVHKGIAVPAIPLALTLAGTWKRFWAYVDSGSTVSIFKASEVADTLFDYASGTLQYVQVGDGGFIPVYLHTLQVALDTMSFPAVIGFSAKLGVEFNLLGRKSIFERFDVTFSDTKNIVTFIEARK